MQSTGRITPALRRLMNDSRDCCRSCNSKLPDAVACYAGYAEDGRPIYVGDCCKQQLHELATHVYWWWQSDKRVAPDTVLWRYMDFARLVALLDSHSLYFARVDQFSDPFEAASGSKALQPRWDEHYLAFFRHSIRTVPGQTVPPDDDYVEREARRLLQDFSRSAVLDRKRMFVSCWHANAGESEALWRLYCPPPIAGLAVQTTARRLTEALGDTDFKIGRVQYIDFSKAYAGIHERVFSKRRSLVHENEVRAVIQKFESTDDTGIAIPIAPSATIAKIIPSPFAPPWFTQLLESTLHKYGVPIPLQPSEILAEPFF